MGELLKCLGILHADDPLHLLEAELSSKESTRSGLGDRTRRHMSPKTRLWDSHEVGVRSSGEREVVGVDVGPSEDHEFWLQFLRQLASRGLSGVRLVISDSHLGLKQAVAQVFVGSTWQRCRVHFMRNALAAVPKVAQQMVAATLRTIFAQPEQTTAHDAVERICRLFAKRYPQLVKVLQEAETDILAFYSFPAEHRRQIWSTNSLERLNKEVSRRCDVVGIFPNRSSLLRLVGAVLEEQHDEWQVGRRYFSTESMNKLLQPTTEEVMQQLLELQSA
jgi:putative transposase